MEKDFARQWGDVWVCGVDEAGRGPLAGPVVAAAVILPFDGRRPEGLRDSKQLSADEREKLFPRIKRMAVSYGIGIASAQEIDLLNILEATRLAARRALAALSPEPGALVTDALTLPGETRPILPLVKGDAISASVAAASILAKVTRDRLMDAYSEEFPEYGWRSNRGYPTPDHYQALEKHGPCILHRMTFNGVGFFDTVPRRSPSYLAFLSRVHQLGGMEGGCGTPLALQDLRLEIENWRERLPPPDYEDLCRLAAVPAMEA